MLHNHGVLFLKFRKLVHIAYFEIRFLFVQVTEMNGLRTGDGKEGKKTDEKATGEGRRWT